MASVSGNLTAGALSATFVPPTANSPFFLQMGPGRGVAYLSMATVASPAQSDFVLMFNPDGTPLCVMQSGAIAVSPPYSALPYGIGDSVAPTFQLSCKALAGGIAAWGYQFNQP